MNFPLPTTERRSPVYRIRMGRGQMLQTGRQLKAARMLAGLKQSELARAAGVNVNTVRNMEAKERIGTAWSTRQLEAALLEHGVELFVKPSLGVRLCVESTERKSEPSRCDNQVPNNTRGRETRLGVATNCWAP